MDNLERYEPGTIANSDEGVVKIIDVNDSLVALYGETYYNCLLLQTGETITLHEDELDVENVEEHFYEIEEEEYFDDDEDFDSWDNESDDDW